MAASRYHKFLNLIKRWPLDPQKGESRDLGAHIRQAVAAAFKEGDQTVVTDPERCDKIYESMEQLVNNKHAADFPTKISVGALAKDLETAKCLNSEEVIKELSKTVVKVRPG